MMGRERMDWMKNDMRVGVKIDCVSTEKHYNINESKNTYKPRLVHFTAVLGECLACIFVWSLMGM